MDRRGGAGILSGLCKRIADPGIEAVRDGQREEEHMKRFRKDHRGFSLIELLVAIAIGSIVIGAVGGILVLTSRSFASTSAEASMQSMSQIVMNHIQDMTIDANQEITYSYSPDGGANWVQIKDDTGAPAGTDLKKLSVKNFDTGDPSDQRKRNRHYELIWDGRAADDLDKTITYTEYKIDDALNDILTIGSDTLATNAVGFSCDLNQLEKKRNFFVSMDFKKSTKTYHAENNVSIRNKVAVSAASIPVSDNVIMTGGEVIGEPGMKLPLALKNIVAKGNFGSRYYFQLKTDEYGNDASGKKGNTYIDGTKVLSIGADETARQVIVTAVSESDPSKTADVAVNIVRVYWTQDTEAALGKTDQLRGANEGITIFTKKNGVETTEPAPGDLLFVSAQVTGYESAPGYDLAKLMKTEYVDFKVKDSVGNVIADKAGITLTDDKLDIPVTVPDGTKIELTYRASHSLKGGGLSARNENGSDYPHSGGITRTKVLTVKKIGNPGPSWTDASIVRGASMKIFNPYTAYEGVYFDTDRYYYRILAKRDVMNGMAYATEGDACFNWDYSGYNTSGKSDSEWINEPDWDHDKAGNKTKPNDPGEDGWIRTSIEEGNGKGGFVQKDDLKMAFSLDHDYLLQGKVVLYRDGVIVGQSGLSTSIVYGLRTAASVKYSDGTHSEDQEVCNLGTLYTLDSHFDYGNNNPQLLRITQTNMAVAELDKTNSFALDLVCGTSLGADSICSPFKGGINQFDDEIYSNVYRDRVYRSSTYKLYADQNDWKRMLPVGESKTYYAYPRFKDIDGSTLVRPIGRWEFTVKGGGNVQRNQGKVLNEGAFFPYPAHTTNGKDVPAHGAFGTIGLTSEYQSINIDYIIHNGQKNGINAYAKTAEHDGKDCVQILLWTSDTNYGEYYYNEEDEEWKYEGEGQSFANNIKIYNGGTQPVTNYDNFIPGPGHVLDWTKSVTLTEVWTLMGSHSFKVNGKNETLRCAMRKDGDTIRLHLLGYGEYRWENNAWRFIENVDKANARVNQTGDHAPVDTFVPYEGHAFDFARGFDLKDLEWTNVGLHNLRVNNGTYLKKTCYMRTNSGAANATEMYIDRKGVYRYKPGNKTWDLVIRDLEYNARIETQYGGPDSFIPYIEHPDYWASGVTLDGNWKDMGKQKWRYKNGQYYQIQCWMRQINGIPEIYLKGRGRYVYTINGKERSWERQAITNNAYYNNWKSSYVPEPGSPEFYPGFSAAEDAEWHVANDFPIYIQGAYQEMMVEYKRQNGEYYYKLEGKTYKYSGDEWKQQ